MAWKKNLSQSRKDAKKAGSHERKYALGRTVDSSAELSAS